LNTYILLNGDIFQFIETKFPITESTFIRDSILYISGNVCSILMKKHSLCRILFFLSLQYSGNSRGSELRHPIHGVCTGDTTKNKDRQLVFDL
jgi:hypothetical protein